MKPCPSPDQLHLLLADALSAQERSLVESHVEVCSDCQETLEKLTEDSVVRLLTPPSSSEGNDTEVRLDFLEPSSRPGSLGRLGNYEVMQVVGRGGFGIVLRAGDAVLQRDVALKVLSPRLADTSQACQRFVREGRAAAAVRQENVVQIYAIEQHPLPYLVLEFVAGESLQQRLERSGPLAAAEVVQIGRQLAEGLAAAHAAGLIHRDVKPSNVLLEAGSPQRLKITDFGLARLADDASLTQSGVMAGTPLYMSPEQASGESVDHRSDLFSLGSVLYALCTGHPPFQAATSMAVLRRICQEAPPPLREVNPDVPPWLETIVARLLAKDPAERFQTAAEVAALLNGECRVQNAECRITKRSVFPSAFGIRHWFVLSAWSCSDLSWPLGWLRRQGLSNPKGRKDTSRGSKTGRRRRSRWCSIPAAR